MGKRDRQTSHFVRLYVITLHTLENAIFNLKSQTKGAFGLRKHAFQLVYRRRIEFEIVKRPHDDIQWVSRKCQSTG